ncbi:MAG: DUF4980 domain-containing protein, partial [bacterium]|nr:DUF4980 domain-containing protein [bacterium]
MLCAVCVAVSLAAGADPILIADFEGSDYGGWQVEGDAFGRGPAKGTLPGQMRVGGYRGDKLANSYYGRDASTGKLISPPFVIERPFISFLIGGGMHPGKTCMNLIVKGEVVRTATGPNDRPGGTESLEWESWDVKDLQGQRGLLEIVDSATGGWGHVNIDHIVQSDRSHKLPDLESAMICEKRYINFPVKTGAAMRQMKMTVDGEVVREFDIELASEDPDFWVFLDLTPFAGKEATLTVKQVPEDDPDALSKLPQTDSFMGA